MGTETVVVVGSGGRESALVEKYSQSPRVEKIIAIPGNDMMQFVSKKPVLTFPKIKTTDRRKILNVCLENQVSLVDIAQDDAVAAGVSDILRKNNIRVIGPSKKSGKIEWSKSFSRKLLDGEGISQPEFFIFNSQEDGIAFLKKQEDQHWFIKADGLAFGKGAMAAKDNDEAVERIKSLSQFGKSGEKYLLEKWLKNDGEIAEEFSAFAISDGKTFKILGFAQDHKRANDGDKGENTGGMGASFPPKIINHNIEIQVEEIYKKTLKALAKLGRPYIGILFLGGILIGRKVYIIEFNARWGDPEAQVIVPSILNDFYELNLAAANGELGNVRLKTKKLSRVSVAVAPFGYPVSKKHVGEEVKGLEKFLTDKSAKIYGAGIKIKNSKFFTTGGRSFHIVGEGESIQEARKKVYGLIGKILKEGNKLHYRTDIGWRDVERLSKTS